ncbi:MAG: hypothetical protein DRP65_11065 [Planctomycetota bacterium]|nr:MAG: hypothetical protein DRP65_11065 [Planctomycetota bacterium]
MPIKEARDRHSGKGDPFTCPVRKTAVPFSIATPCNDAVGIGGVKKAVWGLNKPLFLLLYLVRPIGTIIAPAVSKADYEYLAEC